MMSVVERLDLKPFYEPIQARQGVAGRDATDPQLLVALWCALAYNILHFAATLLG